MKKAALPLEHFPKPSHPSTQPHSFSEKKRASNLARGGWQRWLVTGARVGAGRLRLCASRCGRSGGCVCILQRLCAWALGFCLRLPIPQSPTFGSGFTSTRYGWRTYQQDGIVWLRLRPVRLEHASARLHFGSGSGLYEIVTSLIGCSCSIQFRCCQYNLIGCSCSVQSHWMLMFKI
jgi:hypothetical protein